MRPNWSGQDRGTYDTCDSRMLNSLTSQEHPVNGASSVANRRVSFGEMILAGNLITGSNEATIKASVYPSPLVVPLRVLLKAGNIDLLLTKPQVLQHHTSNITPFASGLILSESTITLSCKAARRFLPIAGVQCTLLCFSGASANRAEREPIAASMLRHRGCRKAYFE